MDLPPARQAERAGARCTGTGGPRGNAGVDHVPRAGRSAGRRARGLKRVAGGQASALLVASLPLVREAKTATSGAKPATSGAFCARRSGSRPTRLPQVSARRRQSRSCPSRALRKTRRHRLPRGSSAPAVAQAGRTSSRPAPARTSSRTEPSPMQRAAPGAPPRARPTMGCLGCSLRRAGAQRRPPTRAPAWRSPQLRQATGFPRQFRRAQLLTRRVDNHRTFQQKRALHGLGRGQPGERAAAAER